MDNALITSQKTKIAEVADTLLKDNSPALGDLYYLLSRIPSTLPPIAEKYENYVTEIGKQFVSDVANQAINVCCIQFVQTLNFW
jgi:Cullin family.